MNSSGGGLTNVFSGKRCRSTLMLGVDRVMGSVDCRVPGAPSADGKSVEGGGVYEEAEDRLEDLVELGALEGSTP